MAAKIDLVIFDCDGVLIDSEKLSAQILLKALDDLSLPVDFEYFCSNFLGRSFPTVARDIQMTFDVILPDDFEQNYQRDLLAKFVDALTPTDGVVPMLDALVTPYCIATSSSPERVMKSLNIVGLADRFGGNVFTACEVKHGKPEPHLFLHAAERMGVDPAHCLVIEDSQSGVEAAIAADMRVLRYTGGSHLVKRALKHIDDVPFFDHWATLFDLAPELASSAGKS